jgi:hypothetical protein
MEEWGRGKEVFSSSIQLSSRDTKQVKERRGELTSHHSPSTADEELIETG